MFISEIWIKTNVRENYDFINHVIVSQGLKQNKKKLGQILNYVV